MCADLFPQLIVLRKLQELADENHREATSQDITIKFKSAWFWELLDTEIWQSNSNELLGLHVTSGIRDDVDASMCLKTHFIDPFQEEQDVVQEQQSLSSGINQVDSLFMGSEDLEHFHIDELSLNFLNAGFEI